MDLDSRRARTAVAREQRLVKWYPDAANDTLLADGFRSLGAKSAKPSADELTQQGKSTARKQMLKLTAREEQEALLARPSGKETRNANRAR